MCVGIPLCVQHIGDDGMAHCADAAGEAYAMPVHTALLDQPPQPGDWLLTHIDTAIRPLEAGEGQQIADALEAVRRASRGEDFEHLIADLVDREPQLPAHLRDSERGG